MNVPSLAGIFGIGTKPRISTLPDAYNKPEPPTTQRSYDTLHEAMQELAPVSPLLKEQVPTGGGRSSSVDSISLYSAIMGEMSMITPNFELELLKLCTHLAKYNGDVSYAVDNVVQLGNTPAVISFDDGVKDDQSKKMIAYIGEAEKIIYRGGMNSLQNDLFAQLAINGAISVEMIPNKTVEIIQRAVLVPPYTIRFRYNPATYDYEPYQKPSLSIQLGNRGNAEGLVKLNATTYRYHALRLFDDNPYAIPPFIAALEMMEIEKDMLKNMRHIVKKLGLFGFLNVLITAPPRKQNETDDAFFNRTKSYLEQIKPEVEKGYANGVVFGFKGGHEFKMEGTNTNVAGAKELIELITQFKSAGLKQDPLMLGRNFNVAETMARVIMAKLTTQVGNYQRVVARFRADLYYLMLTLAGFKLQSVTVEYEPPMIGDKLRDEQAFAAKIENYLTLRDRGIVSQQDAANGIGWEKPHAAKDVDYSVVTAAEKLVAKSKTDPKNTKDPTQASDPTASGATDYSAEDGYDNDLERQLTTEELHFNLHRGIPEYVYEVANCGCGSNHISYANKKDDRLRSIDDYIALYKTSIGKEYQKAVDKVIKKVGIALGDIQEGASLEQVTDKILYILYSQWGGGFTKAQKKIVERWVSEIYGYFRADDLAFPEAAKIPEATFGLHDIRALQYFRNSDELYLGKFITDSDTRKRITAFIKEHYLEGGTPIGKNPEAIARFQQAFGEMLNLEDWKIRRIIDTSVSVMRNYAAIAYIHQTEIQKFQVLGINDGIQCAYCRHMNGMTFDVAKAYERTDNIVQTMPEFVKSNKPFVTSVFAGNSGVEQFLELNEEQIQEAGIDVPSYHPFCRCVVIAVLD